MATKQENAEEYVELAESQYRAGRWRSRGGFRRGGGGGVGSSEEDEASIVEHGASVLGSLSSVGGKEVGEVTRGSGRGCTLVGISSRGA